MSRSKKLIDLFANNETQCRDKEYWYCRVSINVEKDIPMKWGFQKILN